MLRHRGARGPNSMRPWNQATIWLSASRPATVGAMSACASSVYGMARRSRRARISSKVFGEEELGFAISQTSPSGDAVRAVYPELVERMRRLDWHAYDATRVFDHCSEIVYSDNCCHYNRLGNAIPGEFILTQVLESGPVGGARGQRNNGVSRSGLSGQIGRCSVTVCRCAGRTPAPTRSAIGTMICIRCGKAASPDAASAQRVLQPRNRGCRPSTVSERCDRASSSRRDGRGRRLNGPRHHPHAGDRAGRAWRAHRQHP